MIELSGGGAARGIRVAPTDSPKTVLARLSIQPSKGILVVIGGTDDLDSEVAQQLQPQLTSGAVATAVDDGLTVVTGGTAAGVLAIFGSGLEHRTPTAPVIGVVPTGKVNWGYSPERSGDDKASLEPHHTHFVLVEATEWGDETPMLLGLVRELAKHSAAVGLLASGGSIAKRELMGLLDAGIRVIVLSGSGRLADEVTKAVTAAPAQGDPALLSAAVDGRVEVVALDAPVRDLSRRIRQALADARG